MITQVILFRPFVAVHVPAREEPTDLWPFEVVLEDPRSSMLIDRL